jgi:peroxiredoxin
MKHRLLLWTLCLLALGLTSAALAVADDDAPHSLALGSTAPMADVKMKTADGKEIAIADVAGKKGTLVVFTCNGCPYAKAWQTRIATIGNAATKRGLGVIAINANDPDVNSEDSFDGMVVRAKMLGIKYPYAMDETSNIARAFGATRTPEVFLFDAAGKLVYHGTVDDNAHDASAVKQPYLRRAVDAVVAGKSVPVGETKAIGCGIKFRSKA